MQGEHPLVAWARHPVRAERQLPALAASALDELDVFPVEGKNRELSKHPPEFQRRGLVTIDPPARFDMRAIRRPAKNPESFQPPLVDFSRQASIRLAVGVRIRGHPVRVPSRHDPEFRHAFTGEHFEGCFKESLPQLVHPNNPINLFPADREPEFPASPNSGAPSARALTSRVTLRPAESKFLFDQIESDISSGLIRLFPVSEALLAAAKHFGLKPRNVIE
jgi:hypothetical protein